MDKVILLEMQLKDALDREQNLKKLNDSIMSAMNGISNKDNKKELSILNKINEENINKLNDRINTLELENRNRQYLYEELFRDYQQLKEDYDLLDQKDKTCLKCQQLSNQLTALIKKQENEKDGWARESAEALNNLKSINEYDLNVLRMKLKQIHYELDQERKDKEKLHKTLQDINVQHETTQRTLMQQISDLHKSQNDLMMQSSQFQIQSQYRDQQHVQKECQLEQEKQQIEYKCNEYKEQIAKLDHQIKLLQLNIQDKENKHNDQKQDFIRKIVQEKKTTEQFQQMAQRLKDEFQRKQSILLQDSLNKEQQIKTIQTQLTRQKSRNKYYEVTLCQKQDQVVEQHKNSTPIVSKHKKNKYSANEYISQPSHNKNSHSQGNVSKIKLFPSSLQKSETDSINFNVNDMLNSTRADLPNNQSAKQLDDQMLLQIDTINCFVGARNQIQLDLYKTPQVANDIKQREDLQPTSERHQISPRLRIPSSVKMSSYQRVKTNGNDCQKENRIK
ncbi:hypothetical protein pb186bvf_001582 [Paramecium bursaria]